MFVNAKEVLPVKIVLNHLKVNLFWLYFFKIRHEFFSAPLCESDPGVCGEGKCQQSLTPPFYSCNCGNFPSTFGKTINELTKCELSKIY
jgi:hypothetical protein